MRKKINYFMPIIYIEMENNKKLMRKRYYENNKEYIKQKNIEYQQCDEYKEYKKKYNEEHKQELNEYRKQYYKNYYETHKEKVLEIQKKYYQNKKNKLNLVEVN
jgi:hypothetical protein